MAVDVDFEGCTNPAALDPTMNDLLKVIAVNTMAYHLTHNNGHYYVEPQPTIANILAAEQAKTTEVEVEILFKKVVFGCAWILELITPEPSVAFDKDQFAQVWERTVDDMAANAENLKKDFRINPNFKPVSNMWFDLVRQAGAREDIFKFGGNTARLSEPDAPVDDPEEISEIAPEVAPVTEEIVRSEDVKITGKSEEIKPLPAAKANEPTTESSANNTAIFIVVAMATLTTVGAAGVLAYIYVKNKLHMTDNETLSNSMSNSMITET